MSIEPAWSSPVLVLQAGAMVSTCMQGGLEVPTRVPSAATAALDATRGSPRGRVCPCRSHVARGRASPSTARRDVPEEAISAHQWQSVLISVNQCSSVAISAHQWQSVLISGNQCSSVAISGHQWPSVLSSGNQCSSEVISRTYSEVIGGHQWTSEAIRGHQWPSGTS